MVATRPDITFAVTKLAQFSVNPSKEHYQKATYIIRYLLGTQDYKLVYDGASGKGFLAFTDSDWEADVSTRRSMTGNFVQLANCSVSWVSKAQKTIALSSTEAEYMALSDCARQAIWIQSLLAEIGFNIKTMPICGDNQGSVFMGSNPITERRSKHIDIKYHHIRELIEDKKITLHFVPGNDNPADLFTKNLPEISFRKYRDMLGLVIKDSK